MKKEIIPAIIAGSQEELEEGITKVMDLVDWIQLDVMDGEFVPNRSIDFDFTLPETDCRFEAHLMVKDPESWIRKHGDKVDTVLIHIESCSDPGKLARLVKIKGKRVGFALDPDTDIEKIKDLLNSIDQVLVMTVHPGAYGAEFLPETLNKVQKLRQLAPDIDIEVDGGMDDRTIKSAAGAGADLFVSGSFIMKADDPGEAVKALEEQVNKGFEKEVGSYEEGSEDN